MEAHTSTHERLQSTPPACSDARALTESRVEDGQVPAHEVPALRRLRRPPSLPDGQQVAHLKDGEDDKLEEGGRGKGIEQRLRTCMGGG